MSRQQDIRTIRLFAGFDEGEIDAFIAAGENRTVPAEHVFFSMGSSNGSLFIIRSGSVKVDRLGSAADAPLATLRPGETFGEMSFMDGSRTTASVTATELTKVLEFPKASVDRLLAEKPSLGVKLWRNLALDLKQRLMKTNELIDQYIDVNQVLLQDQSLREYYARM